MGFGRVRKKGWRGKRLKNSVEDIKKEKDDKREGGMIMGMRRKRIFKGDL